MYLLIEIRHYILKQCHGIYDGLKNNSTVFENDILRNPSQENLGVLKGDFEDLGVQMMPRSPAY